MKILHVASSMPNDFGGIERYVLYVSTEMSKRGHDVLVTSPSGSPLSARLKAPQTHLGVHSKYDLVAVAQYVRLFQKHKFDAVVTHFSPDYLVPAWAAKISGQRGMILTRHVAAPMRSNRVKSYAKLYCGFIGVSDFVRRKLIEDGVPADRVVTALSGSPAMSPDSNAVAKQKEALNDGNTMIGVFGRLVPEKGHETLLRAVAQVPGCSVHVFGRGRYEERLRHIAAAARLPIRFHGYTEDVAVAMAAMDVICVPSDWDEAFGFTVTEAMSLGKPVIASRVGGIPEIITHGQDGLLFERGSVVELESLLRSLVEDEAECRRLGQSAADTHANRFTVEHMVDRLESAYAQLLKRSI
ncbi:glycosyltransferase family 4 protein [Kamptonema cortianum]|nr:glycosyltransferase family 4 protein [Geitlerinema splendidum]MDK3158363.1 glycosyltransferase family 4 protein [Kamptonema cortianum]